LGVLYNNWLHDVAKRFQKKFDDDISATFNFELGPEFEIAICKVLQDLLPRRFGVCRGFVVGRTGDSAGDDIIIFDAQRFPTIRALATDLSQKERVPAEAMLAYIEAKHTLIVEGDDKSGQSLAKATRQVEAVKAISRPAVELQEVVPGLNLGDGLCVEGPSGYPSTKNPYYAAIWARNLKSIEQDPHDALSRRLADLNSDRTDLPDAIVAGSSIALPAVRSEGNIEVMPFLCASTELVSIPNEIAPWGIALAHMLWAIEWVTLGDLPWDTMVTEQVQTWKSISSGTPPVRGTRFRTPLNRAVLPR
jgi:hypothetical protein